MYAWSSDWIVMRWAGLAGRREEGERGAEREERRRVCKEEVKMHVMRIENSYLF